jgi:hypothetical protein
MRVVYDPIGSNLISAIKYEDPSANGHRISDIYIIDENNMAVLSIKNSQTYIGRYDFTTDKSSYIRALPIFKTDFLGMSRLTSATHFFGVTHGNEFNVQINTLNSKSFSNKK